MTLLFPGSDRFNYDIKLSLKPNLTVAIQLVIVYSRRVPLCGGITWVSVTSLLLCCLPIRTDISISRVYELAGCLPRLLLLTVHGCC